MDVRSNEPFWLIKNALSNSYPSLQTDVSTEILIVGGGITGALMAHQLIKEGYKVIMIDRRDICNGSTAASTSMLQYEIDIPLHKLIEERGLTCAVSSYKNCEKAIKDLEQIIEEVGSSCDFQFKKSIYFCNTNKDEDFLKQEFKSRKEHGFEVKWLTKDELEQMGLRAFAAIESTSGAVLDVYQLANDLLKFSSEKGMRIFDRTDTESIDFLDDRILVKVSSGHVIETKHIVHCTGYESVETIKEDIVKLKSTYALASEAFKNLPEPFVNHIFWNTSSPYLYFRSTSDNRIIMGGEDENFKNAKGRDALLSKKEKKLERAFKECFPDIDFISDYSWAGTFGETKDGLPYMGQPDLNKNEHYILGFGGNGITFSVMGMEAIGRSIQGKPHPFLDYYRFKR